MMYNNTDDPYTAGDGLLDAGNFMMHIVLIG